jgi:DNA-binding winged helix-turn-helix (wHTH) protein/tetratricopeptide (TPR) repeat protein
MSAAPRPLQFDDFELDEENALLTRAGRPVALPPKAFAVLCALIRQPGKLTKKDDLLDAVWGHRHVSESVLKTTISQLRAALTDDVAKPRYIETAARRGYRFIGRVGAPAPPAEAAASVEQNGALIGRRAALAQLHEVWRSVVNGRHRVLWVAGDAGVGKSTLVEHFLREANGALVVRGQCVEQYGAGEPYLPVLEALSSLCRQRPELPQLMRVVAPTWLVQMPWLLTEPERATLHRELAGANQERKIRELAELMNRFTAEQPLLLLTEDLHWSDTATLRLLDHFARRTAPARLLWLGTFRLMQVIAEAHPLKELRQELRLHRLAEEVVLDPFSEVEVAEYVARRMPDAAAPEAFVHKLHDYTGGLPLFLVNVVDNLAAQGAGAFDAALQSPRHTTSWSAPEHLSGAIEKQIGRLPLEMQRLLEAASVCGVEFRASTLASVMQRSADEVGAECDEVAQRQYWLRHVALEPDADGALDARYAFRHALYRHVFYERQGAAARVQLHRRVAAALEQRRDGGAAVAWSELASQYEAGLMYAAALRCYAEAARSALTQFAPREAIDLTAHALALLSRCPDGAERSEIEFALSAHRGVACSQLYGLGSTEAEAAYQRALALCDVLPPAPVRAPVLSGLAWMYYIRGQYRESRALAERLHALSLTHDNPLFILSTCGLLGVINTMQARYTEAREWLERGIRLCEQLGEAVPHSAFVADPLVVLRVNIAVALLHLGAIDQAREHMDAALTRAQQRGQLMARTIAVWCAAMFEMRMQRPQVVAQHAQALSKLVTDNALVQAQGPSRWIRGWAEAYLGSPEEGLRSILEGFEFNRRLGMISGGAEVLGYAVEALTLAQDWPRAQAHLDEATKLAHGLEERILYPYLHMRQALIHRGRGDIAAAREALLQALEEARAQQSLWMQLRALILLCELPNAVAADREALAQVYERFQEGRDIAWLQRARELLAG